MSSDPIAPVLRELLVRQLEAWLPAALKRSRRATLALAYADGDARGADDALRAVAAHADRLRGSRLAVVVLAAGAADLPARLGPIEAALPADVAVHVVPGGPDRLPVALKAAGAAGAPLLSVVDLGVPTAGAAGTADPTPPAGLDPAVLAAAAGGRPSELLLWGGGPARGALTAAGFPLVAEAELVAGDGGTGTAITLGTGWDRSLEAFKDALWAVDAGLRYGDPADPEHLLDVSRDPDPGPLRRELLAELARSGPRTVSELRRHTLTATVYRSADAVRALTGLVDDGEVVRERESGRLAGDEFISLAG